MEEQGQPVVTEENLEAFTNAAEGHGQFPEVKPQEPATTQAPQQAENLPEVESRTPAQPQSGKVDLAAELLELLKDTPYVVPDPKEAVLKLKEGYKSLQGEFTKTREKVKPYEQLVDKASRDPNFANLLRQAQMFYDNPNLAAPYLQPNSAIPPDPRQYDVFTEEGLGKYNQALGYYQQRMIDERINSQLGDIRASSARERSREAFKQLRKDVDPDELETWARTELNNLNPLEAAYRIKNFEAAQQSAMEQARKELNKQIETAQQTRTPSAPASVKGQYSADDVIGYIDKHGIETAFKKFGEKDVMKIVEQFS